MNMNSYLPTSSKVAVLTSKVKIGLLSSFKTIEAFMKLWDSLNSRDTISEGSSMIMVWYLVWF